MGGTKSGPLPVTVGDVVAGPESRVRVARPGAGTFLDPLSKWFAVMKR